MTNDPEPHQNGASDDLAAIAAAPTRTENTPATEPPSAESAEAVSASAAAAEPAPEAPSEPAAPSFDDLGLHPMSGSRSTTWAISHRRGPDRGVQAVSEGKDLLSSRAPARKTTAFGLPTISKIIPSHRATAGPDPRANPELALQVSRELTQLGKHRGVLVEANYGGAPIGKQINALRDGVPHDRRDAGACSTTSATHARLRASNVHPRRVRRDAVDGLPRGHRARVSHLPDASRRLLFSATMPEEVQATRAATCGCPSRSSVARRHLVAEIHHATTS